MTDPASRPEFLSTRLLAERWGWHQESVRRFLREGRLPAARFGKRKLSVRLNDVLDYEARTRVQRVAHGLN